MNKRSRYWLLLIVIFMPYAMGCSVRDRVRAALGIGSHAPQAEAESAAIDDSPAPVASVQSDNDRLLYLFGRQLGDSIDRSLTLRPAEIAIVQAGLSDRLRGVKSPVALAGYDSMLATLLASRGAEHLLLEKQRGHQLLAQAAHEAGAKRSKSGVVYVPFSAGSGPSPRLNDSVDVQLQLRLSDQTIVDDTRSEGHPSTVVIGHTVPCLSEGLQLMKPGEKARLVCPSDLAYGDGGAMPKIPGGAAVTFDVELVAVHTVAAVSKPTAPRAKHVRGRAGNG
jgi:FKBP-type peptidyl-prolyl cis-trans isomerase FkpA